ncbi:DUF1003 domain-containing protein [Deinococcus planocerae]|uniref:DUF1003 domain-containing protein n=1 Tax=Deinococcus planocerae TaxID=1737569 RepID=UPI000C7EAD38|nr:DUF1003 domain-containing protein [Deinococcus planocerae]
MRKSLSRWRRRPREETVQALIQENIAVNQVLQARAEESLTRLHRPIEQIGALVGRPAFVAGFLALCLLWIGTNLGLKWDGKTPWDPPPFPWMQDVFGLLGLLVTTVVLVAQARQGQINEQRAQLALQIALLTEQRSAKIIELLEELRRDLPNVHNRLDPEAEVMMQASDPAAIVEALTPLEAGRETSLPPGGSASGESAAAREEGRRDADLLPG